MAPSSRYFRNRSITARQNPSKAVLLEEYLHGVQINIGIPQRLSRDYAEWHVRDFMIRHQVLVGLGDEDIARLGEGRAYEARKPDVQEKIASETNRKQQVRTEVRREVSAEHRAAHGLGAASMVVNTAEGNYAAAGIDAAGMLAENHTVQKTLAQTAVKTGAAEVFEHVAKRIPLIGAGVTVGFVAFAAGKHAWAGDYSLAMGELVAGSTEAAGNIVGFGLGDVAREGTRQGLILAGGDHMAGVEKSGIRQLGEGG